MEFEIPRTCGNCQDSGRRTASRSCTRAAILKAAESDCQVAPTAAPKLYLRNWWLYVVDYGLACWSRGNNKKPPLTAERFIYTQAVMSNNDGFTGLIEFSPGFAPRPGITHVLFDFDGTLSLIRQGWPDVMVPMFAEMLPPLPGETDEDRRRLAFEDIMRLNGKQTIYQMIQLAERIKERGGQPKDPLWYKHEYLRRLDLRIKDRIEGLKNGLIKPDDMLVYRARHLLEELCRRGMKLHLASGTDVQFVRQEADLLGLTPYFGPNIHGALDDYKRFSKQLVIEAMLRDYKIPGENLLSFGDGYVEIQNTKEVGGLAVAVASDEAHNGSGRMDEWKRQRLLGVGADVVIPDFRDAILLLEIILGERDHPNARGVQATKTLKQ